MKKTLFSIAQKPKNSKSKLSLTKTMISKTGVVLNKLPVTTKTKHKTKPSKMTKTRSETSVNLIKYQNQKKTQKSCFQIFLKITLHKKTLSILQKMNYLKFKV
jgi:hypothetical protein